MSQPVRFRIERGHTRKPVHLLVRPEFSPDGPALTSPPLKLAPWPMIERLRAIGAPMFEDIVIRARRAPPLPAQFRRTA